MKVDQQAQNYLYTNRSVPFHWDGAFAGRVPRYIFFVTIKRRTTVVVVRLFL